MASLLLNFLFCFGHLNSKASSSPDAGLSHFVITNTADSTNADNYLVVFDGGKYWWSIDGSVLSMNIGLHQEATVRLDPATGKIKSTTIGLLNEDGKECFFTDLNADGWPDKKRIAGQEETFQIFYQSEFIPSFTKGKDRYIFMAGAEKRVRFDGKHWVTD